MSDIILKEQEDKIIEKTPKKYIKKRPGRGGKEFDYVETGYVISKLNEICNYMWSFEILHKEIVGNNIIVQGRLTLHTKNGNITKEQFGSAEIKREKGSKEAIDLADDFKAAASDCLKKCASLVGIALDVYWKQEMQPEVVIQQTTQQKDTKTTKHFVAFNEFCKLHLPTYSHDDRKNLWRIILNNLYKVDSSSQLTKEQLDELTEMLKRAMQEPILVFQFIS